MRLPASLREFSLFRPDIFHNLEEGEVAKFRPRFKKLLKNWHASLFDTKAEQLDSYQRALDTVDDMGALIPPYALLGKRPITQYHLGWVSATAFFGWDHVNILFMMPMLLGFNDTVLPKRLRLRVVKAAESVLEVHRLAYKHNKVAADCLLRKWAIIR